MKLLHHLIPICVLSWIGWNNEVLNLSRHVRNNIILLPMVLTIFKYLNLTFDHKYFVDTNSLHDISKVLKYHNLPNMLVSIPDIAAPHSFFLPSFSPKTKYFIYWKAKTQNVCKSMILIKKVDLRYLTGTLYCHLPESYS
jgi:hypothetical protein